MRTVSGLALLALTLSACSSSVPKAAEVIDLRVDGLTLAGPWFGIAQAVDAGVASRELAFRVDATYATPKTYVFTGKLRLDDQIYMVSGKGSVYGNVTLQPQTTPLQLASQWAGKLSQNGVEVGSISSDNGLYYDGRHRGHINLGMPLDRVYTFTLNRLYSSANP